MQMLLGNVNVSGADAAFQVLPKVFQISIVRNHPTPRRMRQSLISVCQWDNSVPKRRLPRFKTRSVGPLNAFMPAPNENNAAWQQSIQ
jgi:hypothetical protein